MARRNLASLVYAQFVNRVNVIIFHGGWWRAFEGSPLWGVISNINFGDGRNKERCILLFLFRYWSCQRQHIYTSFYYLDFSFIISVDVLVGVNSSLFAQKCFRQAVRVYFLLLAFSFLAFSSLFISISLHLLSLLSLFFPYWRKMYRHFGISFVISLFFSRILNLLFVIHFWRLPRFSS